MWRVPANQRLTGPMWPSAARCPTSEASSLCTVGLTSASGASRFRHSRPRHCALRSTAASTSRWIAAGSLSSSARAAASVASSWISSGRVIGVDMHVHLPTGDWVCGCVGHYLDSVERYFGRRPQPESIEDLYALYERLDLAGVLLGWDAQGKEIGNGELAAICARGDRFVGFGCVDPNREDALDRLAAFPSLGLRGLKLHPTMQAFD